MSASPGALDDLRIGLELVAGGFERPLAVANAGDDSGRLFIVEQRGRIRVVTDGQVAETPFLDITDRIMAGGERGLLGLAFHPDFETNGRFFVDYSATNGDQVIAEYGLGLDADTGDPDGERILIRLKDPSPTTTVAASAFGPDGYLYIAMGDGGSGGDPLESGESLDTLLGKILRIDVDGTDGDLPYAIPADNPFRETAGARPEIGFTGCAIRGASRSIA